MELIDFIILSYISESRIKVKNYLSLDSGWRSWGLHKLVQSDLLEVQIPSQWFLLSKSRCHIPEELTIQDHCCLSLPGVLAPRSFPASETLLSLVFITLHWFSFCRSSVSWPGISESCPVRHLIMSHLSLFSFCTLSLEGFIDPFLLISPVCTIILYSQNMLKYFHLYRQYPPQIH